MPRKKYEHFGELEDGATFKEAKNGAQNQWYKKINGAMVATTEIGGKLSTNLFDPFGPNHEVIRVKGKIPPEGENHKISPAAKRLLQTLSQTK